MFIGEYQHTIDHKGRMAIPAKFRKGLAKGAVVTRGIDNCLFLYPMSEWEDLAEKLKKLPINQANARAFVRLMFAGATDVQINSQGRILIPEYLRKYAGLNKKAIIAGLYNRIEIWAQEKWQIYKSNTERASENIAEQLGDLGV